MSEGKYVSGGRSPYGDLFEEWEVTAVRNAVVDFVARYPWLRFPDFDDLLQECLTQWFFTRDRFEQGRGASIKTYMSKVVSLRLKEILRKQMSYKRRLNHQARSLDEPVGEFGETLADNITADGMQPDIALRVDVQSVFGQLT